MSDSVSRHYGAGGRLAERIAAELRSRGLDPERLRAADLEALDEFHFLGRAATLELVDWLDLRPESQVLDIGSGLGGVSRTIAEHAGCHVTGVDLTEEFCEAAAVLSDWVGLSGATGFRQGDATRLPFPDAAFDGAVTVHVAMNVADKPAMYAEARRVLKPGARFGVYDILQGEGGEVLYPAPWASEPSISHLATPNEMSAHLRGAGFTILHEADSTAESQRWLEDRMVRPRDGRAPPVTTQFLFGSVSREMARNQVIGLRERRMLTYAFVCEA